MSAETPQSSRIVYVDRALWQQLGQATSTPAFCRAWLALQCSMLGDGMIDCAVVVFGEPDVGPYVPTAHWPETRRPTAQIAELAEECLAAREPVVATATQGRQSIAYPLLVDGHVYGVVALAMRGSSADARAAIRHLQWGSAWLDGHVRRLQSNDDAEVNQRLMTALDLIAVALAEDSFADTARALVTELATLLECDRAGLGVRHAGHVRVVALSHSAMTGSRMNLLRRIGAAMDEAVDQGEVLTASSAVDAAGGVTLAHRELAGATRSAVLTLPLSGPSSIFGALSLERPHDRDFEPADIELCRSVAMAVGPLLQAKLQRDRPWLARLAGAARARIGRVLGPDNVLRKLTAATALVALAAACVIPGTYRVPADSTLEGAQRRIIAAPIEGFLISADVRPGDTVAAGDRLAAFDERDLKLERLQVAAEQAQLGTRLQEAVATRERAQAQVIRAQLEQSAAHLELIDEQLERARISAPFDAIVVSGDLSQSLGAPVQRGEILFEIAPLDAYRVVLEVDEHDIAAVREGQAGTLVLAALPNEPLSIVVRRVTPVATAEEGINYFRVEADLASANERIRPGMEGVAKVDIGRERQIWIFTHELIRWLKLKAWSWMP